MCTLTMKSSFQLKESNPSLLGIVTKMTKKAKSDKKKLTKLKEPFKDKNKNKKNVTS